MEVAEEKIIRNKLYFVFFSLFIPPPAVQMDRKWWHWGWRLMRILVKYFSSSRPSQSDPLRKNKQNLPNPSFEWQWDYFGETHRSIVSGLGELSDRHQLVLSLLRMINCCCTTIRMMEFNFLFSAARLGDGRVPPRLMKVHRLPN